MDAKELKRRLVEGIAAVVAVECEHADLLREDFTFEELASAVMVLSPDGAIVAIAAITTEGVTHTFRDGSRDGAITGESFTPEDVLGDTDADAEETT